MALHELLVASHELLVDHAKLVRQQSLGTTKRDNLSIRGLRAKQTGLQMILDIHILQSGVVGAARGLRRAFGVLGI